MKQTLIQLMLCIFAAALVVSCHKLASPQKKQSNPLKIKGLYVGMPADELRNVAKVELTGFVGSEAESNEIDLVYPLSGGEENIDGKIRLFFTEQKTLEYVVMGYAAINVVFNASTLNGEEFAHKISTEYGIKMTKTMVQGGYVGWEYTAANNDKLTIFPNTSLYLRRIEPKEENKSPLMRGQIEPPASSTLPKIFSLAVILAICVSVLLFTFAILFEMTGKQRNSHPSFPIWVKLIILLGIVSFFWCSDKLVAAFWFDSSDLGRSIIFHYNEAYKKHVDAESDAVMGEVLVKISGGDDTEKRKSERAKSVADSAEAEFEKANNELQESKKTSAKDKKLFLGGCVLSLGMIGFGIVLGNRAKKNKMKCPFCGATIEFGVLKCRFCSSDLPQETSSQPFAQSATQLEIQSVPPPPAEIKLRTIPRFIKLENDIIHFECGYCNQVMEIDAVGAGVEIKCPECGTNQTVPTS